MTSPTMVQQLGAPPPPDLLGTSPKSPSRDIVPESPGGGSRPAGERENKDLPGVGATNKKTVPPELQRAVAIEVWREEPNLGKIRRLLAQYPGEVSLFFHDAETGNTSLHRFAYLGCIDLLKVVLQETGCTVDARNALQRTALHLACERGQRLVCEELIAQKADVNATSGGGTTPLHYACRSQALSVVELLLQQQGIAIDVEDNTRRTPLQSVPEGCDLIRDRLQAFLEGTMQDDEFDA